MKLLVKDVVEALDLVSAVPEQAVLPSSQFVRWSSKGGAVSLALSGVMVAEARVAQSPDNADWEVLAERKVLQAFLGLLKKDGELQVTVQDGQATLKLGRHKLEIASGQEAAGYGSWDGKGKGAQELKLDAAQREALSGLAQYCPAGPAAPSYKTVYIEAGWGAMASDSTTIAAIEDRKITATYTIPMELAQVLKSSGDGKLQVDAGGMGARFPRGYWYQPVNADLKKNFPAKALKDLLAKCRKAETRITIPAKDLARFLGQYKPFVRPDSLLEIAWAENVLRGKLDFDAGNFSGAVACKQGHALAAKWAYAPLAGWAAGLPDGDAPVSYGMYEHCHVFQAKGRILVFVDLA